MIAARMLAAGWIAAGALITTVSPGEAETSRFCLKNTEAKGDQVCFTGQTERVMSDAEFARLQAELRAELERRRDAAVARLSN